MALDSNDFLLFAKLFGRNGYVLDFSNSAFAAFSIRSIGLSLQEKYGGSKEKSLLAYLDDRHVSDNDKWEIIKNLFNYYEVRFVPEYDSLYSDDQFIPGLYEVQYKFNRGRSELYDECKKLIHKHNSERGTDSNTIAVLKTKIFSSSYLRREIDGMEQEIETNPTDAIGKSKELIESCCKTILEEMSVDLNKNWDVPQLADETMKHLHLNPRQVSVTGKAGADLRAIYGNLRGIVTKLAELRNDYGSGHGKSNTYQGLDPRHARLAVNCSFAFCLFAWDTWQEMKSTCNKDN